MLSSALVAALALAAGEPVPAATPAIEPLPAPPASAHLGVLRARTVSGPYAVPGMIANDTSDDNGMGSYVTQLTLPCSNCYITGAEFSLAYPEVDAAGSRAVANVDSGMYLHHAVLINANRSDAVCTQDSASHLQRTFGTGNERGYLDLTLNGTRRTGYYVGADDMFFLAVEVMNQRAGAAREVVITTAWDYATNTTDFKAAVPIWLDIDGACGTYTNGSEVAVPADAHVFSYPSPDAWSPAAAYEVLVAGSHMHDGGTRLDIAKNGAVVCEGVAHYGETPGYVSTLPDDGMSGMPGMNMAASKADAGQLAHISSIHTCFDLGATSASDKWTVTAHYNMTEHPGMETTDGAVKPIMGIGLLYLMEV